MERRSAARGAVRGGGSNSRSSSESPRRSQLAADGGVKNLQRSAGLSTPPRSSSIGTPTRRTAAIVTTTPGKAGVVTKGKLKIMPTSATSGVSPAVPSTSAGAKNINIQTGTATAGSAAGQEMDKSTSEVLNTSVEGEPEEPQVLLNSRGRPARQIKRNRFYYDGDNINDETAIWKQTHKVASPKKVKQEPLEIEEVLEDDTADFPHTDIESTPVSARVAFPKGTLTNRPTPVEVAQALTAIVKPKQGRATIPGRQVHVKQEKGVSTTAVPTPKKVDPPKAAKQTPIKYIRTETPKVSTPKGNQTPMGRTELPKPVGKLEIRSTGKNDVGKSDRPLHASPSTNVSIERPREIHKIKKEKDADLVSSLLTEGNSREDKHRLKKEKDRLAREKERRDLRREKEREDEEDDDYNPNRGKGRQRSSLSDSFSENVIVVPNETLVDMKPSLDKKSAQEISLRLRNLLKLPKAHKWVCYEWFYSNVDKVLFDGENDFQICFRESFPQLKARKLTRVQWTKIRRLMGKPRRCSQSFFDEEREELARRRQKIRMIQQRKVTDFNYKELPDEIPLQLVIGTKVTSRLRRPQDGLFTGTIEGVDTSNNTYRITFDRPGLGTHSIPDYEVLSNELPETVSTSSFALKIPRRSYGAFSGGQFKFQNSNLADELNGFPKSPFPVDGMLGGFPIRLLDMIVRLSKLLKAKREKILQLKELNVEAEKMRSYGRTFNSDFRCRYARCVLDLSSMNKEMAIYLDGVQQYCLEIAPDHGSNQMIIPEHIQDHCDQEAALIVSNCNGKPNRMPVQGTKALTLITKLASMMLQVKTLSSGDRNLYELKSIKDSLKQVKATLEGRNVQLFQDRVEIPMNRIQAGLTMSGNH